MAAPMRLQVRGLRELARDLKAVDAQLPRILTALNSAAARYVAGNIRTAALGQGSTAAHVAPSITPSSGRAYARVNLGGDAFPMAGGAEFGAGHNLPRQTARGTVRGWNQFPAWRGNGDEAGYFFYPTIRRDIPSVGIRYEQLLDVILDRLSD